ncbi:defensin-like [Chelonus insularis]|uniref:defensin-like n=1 Tax=Chelonus insularis TaxID=460826 RepID=UPI00158CEF50|nr:defensin-like [Chelonus insularis]
MTKFMIIVLLLTVSVAVMSAPSFEEYEPLELRGEEFEIDGENEDHLRHRRVTCDLLSFKGVVNDSACAANCLSMGKSGGSCRNGVCVCRKDKIVDLWKKRFG